MRTTLPLYDDVAAQEDAVNSALRRGLSDLNRRQARKPFRTKPLDMGPCLIPSLDNVWEVLDEVNTGNRQSSS